MSAPRDPDAILAAWLDDGPAGPPVLHPPCDHDRRPVDAPVADRPRPARVEAIDVQVRRSRRGRRGRRDRRRRRRHRPAQAFRRDRRNNAIRLAEPEPKPQPDTFTDDRLSLAERHPPRHVPPWETYESERYGFTIGHPGDWDVVPATRDWTFDADGRDGMISPAQEAFGYPGGSSGIRVSAWSVPRALAEGDLEAWVQAYCERTGNKPCTGIADRAVPICLESPDCHPGVLVPFDDAVQAFLTLDDMGAPVTVVAVWWGESAQATAPYGGSRKLLEAFLKTMDSRPLP